MSKIPKDGKPYRKTVTSILNQLKPTTIVDIACGGGWVGKSLDYQATIHGMDLYAPPRKDMTFSRKSILTKAYQMILDNTMQQYVVKQCCICKTRAYF